MATPTKLGLRPPKPKHGLENVLTYISSLNCCIQKAGSSRHDLHLRRAEIWRKKPCWIDFKKSPSMVRRVVSERKDQRGAVLHEGFDGALSRPVRSTRRRDRSERPERRPGGMSPRRP